MSKRVKLHSVQGTSNSGSPHGLLIERDDDKGTVMLTVVGHDGKKRHASVNLSFGDYYALIQDMAGRF